jgi:hypothetical protein
VLHDSDQEQNLERDIALIVLEQGATWPTWLAERSRELAGSVVVAQAPGETSLDFAHRVLRRVGSVQSDSDEDLTSAFLVSNGDESPNANAARVGVARGIIAAMSGRHDSQLVLTACRSAGSGHASHQLLALAGVLCEGLTGSHVTVRVRVDEPHAESGTRQRAPAVGARTDEAQIK